MLSQVKANISFLCKLSKLYTCFLKGTDRRQGMINRSTRIYVIDKCDTLSKVEGG